MLLETPVKYDIIFDVDRGVLPFDRRQNSVFRCLKSGWSILQSKRRTGIPVQAIIHDKGRLIHVDIVQLYFIITTVAI